jgi:hypothetical protein
MTYNEHRTFNIEHRMMNKDEIESYLRDRVRALFDLDENILRNETISELVVGATECRRKTADRVNQC